MMISGKNWEEKSMAAFTDRPEVGDLVVTEHGDIGIITLIDPVIAYPYFVEWVSGIRCGHTTMHPIRLIKEWKKNFKK